MNLEEKEDDEGEEQTQSMKTEKKKGFLGTKD